MFCDWNTLYRCVVSRSQTLQGGESGYARLIDVVATCIHSSPYPSLFAEVGLVCETIGLDMHETSSDNDEILHTYLHSYRKQYKHMQTKSVFQ